MDFVGFLLKREQPDAAALCQTLVTALRTRGKGEQELVIAQDGHGGLPQGVRTVKESELPDDLKLLVVLGGDGTLLYGAGLVRDATTPILGVNLGHLGFLTTCAPQDAVACMSAALDGDLLVEQRHRLSCQVLRKVAGKLAVIAERPAVNDVVLSQPGKARLLELATDINGQRVTVFKADGLIIATPTGSTAYNLAAGGPILSPQIEAVVVTPICPHALTARPLVTPLHSSIEVRGLRAVDEIMLTVDGQWSVRLEYGDLVRIACAPQPLRLFQVRGRTFYDLLRGKLHWGVRE